MYVLCLAWAYVVYLGVCCASEIACCLLLWLRLSVFWLCYFGICCVWLLLCLLFGLLVVCFRLFTLLIVCFDLFGLEVMVYSWWFAVVLCLGCCLWFYWFVLLGTLTVLFSFLWCRLVGQFWVGLLVKVGCWLIVWLLYWFGTVASCVVFRVVVRFACGFLLLRRFGWDLVVVFRV